MKNTIIIRGGLVFDGTGEPPIHDGLIFIEDEKVVRVCENYETEFPHQAQIIDAHGSFMMPGLINAHDHLSWDTINGESLTDVSKLIAEHNAYLALRTARSGINSLRSGVTTVRNLGEVRYVDLQCRRAYEEGLIPGPRVIASGPWVATSHAWITFPGVTTCDGVDEVRKFVRSNLRAGVDFIKIFIGGELLGLCNTNPHLTYISKEEIQVAITEAHLKGKMVTAHIMSSRTPGFNWAVEAGIDTIEHGIWFTTDDFQSMKSNGINLVVAGGWWLDDGFGESVYPDGPIIVKEWYERVIDSGVYFAVGVDGRGEINAMQKEIERFVRYGLDNNSALVAATSHGAKICGVDDIVGTIHPGKIADIIVIDGNPLENITDLRNVRTVIKSGKIFDIEKMDKIL